MARASEKQTEAQAAFLQARQTAATPQSPAVVRPNVTSKPATTPDTTPKPTGGATQGADLNQSAVTPDNFLSSKRVGLNYEVQAVGENGQIFTRQMTRAEYDELRTVARSTGKKESLEMRGQRNQLEMRRVARQATQNGPGQAAVAGQPQVSASQLQETAQKATREIEGHMNEVKKLSSSSDRLVSKAQEARSTIVGTGDKAFNAEPLYMQISQYGQEIDRLYVEINELQRSVKNAKTVAEMTEKTAQAAQKAKRVDSLVQEMEQASQQLRQMEMSATVKMLGKTRVTAQQKLAQVRQLLQTANTAKIPASETKQLRKALQQAEKALNSTEKVSREALTLGRQGSVDNAIDKASYAQRQIESAMQNVDEYVQDFRQMWSSELKAVFQE